MDLPLPVEPDAPAPHPPGEQVRPRSRSLARGAARPLLRLWLRLRADGAEHVPEQGPVIVAATHASHADSVAVGVAVRRPLLFLGDEELTSWPLLGPWLPRLGMIPVQRGSADAQVLDQLAALLEAGHAVVIYPEGSRSRDGRVYRPRSGVSRLAASTGAPVVPCGIEGTREVWPAGRRPSLRRGRATVRFGPALVPPRPDPASRRRFNTRLHEQLVTLARSEAAEGFAPIGGGVA